MKAMTTPLVVAIITISTQPKEAPRVNSIHTIRDCALQNNSDRTLYNNYYILGVVSPNNAHLSADW